MPDNPSSPLLGDLDQSQPRPSSNHSHHYDESHENTPLLSRTESTPRYGGADEDEQDAELIPSPATTSLRSLQNGHAPTSYKKTGHRWPTTVAVGILGVIMIAIITGAFFAPAAVEEYAKQSLVIEPTSLSINGFTSTGVTARIQAIFRMDASRVQNKHVRNIGRFGTWLAREVETEPSTVSVYLPEYGNILVGTAAVPRIAVDIRNGHGTAIDFLTDLEPGDLEGIRRVANDWLEGRLDRVRVFGKADVGLKSGFFSLGTQTISESLDFEGSDIPAIPEYNITKLNFHEVPVSTSGRRGMGADVSLSLTNNYPIALTIPPLSFDILVSNCEVNDPYIRLADATTGVISIEPRADVAVDVGGIVRELPKSLLQACPRSKKSPLDLLLGDYIHGNYTTIFVRGSTSPSSETPEWIATLMAGVTVPVPFPGHTFDKLIKNFTLADPKFKFPGIFSNPDANPTISGNIVVIAGLPKEMNFGINVTGVRASSHVIYKNKKLGDLNIKDFQPAQSERIEGQKGENADLKIQAMIEDAPLEVTDDEVLQDILSQYFVGGPIDLKIVATVDAMISTVLGEIQVRGLPAEGVIPVIPVSLGGGFAALAPKVGDLKITSTGKTSLYLQAHINFTNPTEYSAEVGYFNIHILSNGSIVGDATARNINVATGNNSNILVEATWDPAGFGGKKAANIGRELLSQYISGFNTTLTFQVHERSFAHQPKIGKALKHFPIEIPTPRISIPNPGGDNDGDGDGANKPQFIDDATFHLLSSTAQFTLISPLQFSTIYIEDINATAFYNHTEPVGRIIYNLPFKVPPGHSTSPKLPVDWSFNSVGYEALQNALGGTLKLDAKGTVGVRLGQWSETVWYVGSGIGASIRL